ncbi:MAG: hypothetical protein Q9227_000811 [Pyrenula ochraceoflavens]
MHFEYFLCLWALFARLALSDPSFTYPPAFEETTDFSSNIVMREGDFKVIQWQDVDNPDQARISITMFQLNGTQFIGDSEYVIRELTSLANSHYFNISAKSATTSSSSTTTSQTLTSSSPATKSAAASSSPSPSTASSSSGLSSGAKAGIAVGVIGATLIGVLTGWLLLGRKRRGTNNAPSSAPPPSMPYEPVKMEQQFPYEVHGEALPPVLYELPNQTGQKP